MNRKALESILESLKTGHAVLGLCVVDEFSVLANNLPPVFGNHLLLKTHRDTRTLKRTIDAIGLSSVHYLLDSAGGKLFVYLLDELHALVALCARDVNYELLKMSVEVSAPQILGKIAENERETSTMPPAAQQPNRGAGLPEAAIAELRSALALSLGAAANPVFDRIAQNWQPGAEPIERLVSSLCEHIHAPIERASFQRLALRVLSAQCSMPPPPRNATRANKPIRPPIADEVIAYLYWALTSRLGPTAHDVVNQHHAPWKAAGGSYVNLVALLSTAIESESERAQFEREALDFIGRSRGTSSPR